MTSWFHTIILATCAAATIAVGFASAAVYSERDPAAKKADRLVVSTAANTDARMIAVVDHQQGYSVITRVPVADAN
jgi:predicted nucleic acid-binding protein